MTNHPHNDTCTTSTKLTTTATSTTVIILISLSMALLAIVISHFVPTDSLEDDSDVSDGDNDGSNYDNDGGGGGDRSNRYYTYYSQSDLLHALCGAIGSAISITILYPLETVRTRLQVMEVGQVMPVDPGMPDGKEVPVDPVDVKKGMTAITGATAATAMTNGDTTTTKGTTTATTSTTASTLTTASTACKPNVPNVHRTPLRRIVARIQRLPSTIRTVHHNWQQSSLSPQPPPGTFRPFRTVRPFHTFQTFQHLHSIYQSQGLPSLYRGWFSLVVALMALNFIYFYCFHFLRRVLPDGFHFLRRTLSLLGLSSGFPSGFTGLSGLRVWQVWQSKVAMDLLAGYLAGVTAAVVTGPLWLVNTRLKLQGVQGVHPTNSTKLPSQSTSNSTSTTNFTSTANSTNSTKPLSQSTPQLANPMKHPVKYHGILHCLQTILRTEGPLALWNGTLTSVVLAWNPAIQLGVYELLKRMRVGGVGTVGGAVGTGAVGGTGVVFVNALLSKFISTLVTYPIQVIQTRHRANANCANDANSTGPPTKSSNSCKPLKPLQPSILHELTTLLQTQGPSGLYRGLESKLIQTCLTSAIMFVIYENLLEVLEKVV